MKKKKNKRGKKKDGPKGYPSRRPNKMNFYIRAQSGNHDEIEAKKKIRFLSTRQRERKKKEKRQRK